VWEGTTGVVKGVFGLAEMAEHQAEEPARLAEALRERGLDGLISEVRSELDREERLVRGLITEARRLGDLTNRLGPTAPFYFAADARRHGIDHALSHLAHDAGTLVPQAVLMVATDGLGEATTAEAESAAAVDDVATATHAPMPTTFADLPEPAGWGRLETLADHLRDHMRDLGARDAEEYVGQADQLLDEAREGKHLVRVDPDKNIIRVYDPETRRFGSYNVDGTAKTFFRPKRLDYFDGRQGRLIRG
jgi:hypothetical protein